MSAPTTGNCEKLKARVATQRAFGNAKGLSLGMMRALAESLPARDIADCKLFNDSDDAIAFLLISKAK